MYIFIILKYEYENENIYAKCYWNNSSSSKNIYKIYAIFSIIFFFNKEKKICKDMELLHK